MGKKEFDFVVAVSINSGCLFVFSLGLILTLFRNRRSFDRFSSLVLVLFEVSMLRTILIHS